MGVAPPHFLRNKIMKLTKSKLKQIIREEYKKISEASYEDARRADVRQKHMSDPSLARKSNRFAANTSEPESNPGSITVEDPAGFYQAMIDIYTRTGMDKPRAYFQRMLDDLQAGAGQSDPPL